MLLGKCPALTLAPALLYISDGTSVGDDHDVRTEYAVDPPVFN